MKNPIKTKILVVFQRTLPNTSDEKPKWWKIVVMQHVKKGVLQQFLNELQAERTDIIA